MSTPSISVAMGVYNNAAFLGEAIESILAQTAADFEFLIVNDGSTDSSGAIIDDFARRDARIRPLHQENQGLIASLNRAIAEARAPLIARMDGDDVSLPERFSRQIAFLEANPDHGVVGTNTHDLDEQGRLHPCTDFHPLDHASFAAALDQGSPLCHPSVMMRRDVMRRVGGYHAAYRHCEDYDLWLRLSMHTRLASIPDRLLHYRRSAGQVSNRHIVAQQTGAAIARLAHHERLAGRPDPTEDLRELPPIDQLDALFGRPGVARAVRARLARGLVYSRDAMRGDGFDIVSAHIRDGGAHQGLWRTVARLAAFGEPRSALRLAMSLLSHRPAASDPPARTLG